jgi:hypothetical protein
MNKNLPSYVIAAAASPAAYSKEFSEQVAALAKDLSGLLQRPVRHDSDMNYRAGQNLEFDVQAASPRSKSPVPVQVRVYISGKAPLFGVYCIERRRVFERSELMGDQIPSQVLTGEPASTINKVRQLLAKEGYQEVEEELFPIKVPGALTELDGLPSTVFQALFAEIT